MFWRLCHILYRKANRFFMRERRRNVRYPVSIKLSICDLYKQNYSGVHELETPIEVENISISGLSFVTEGVLPVGYYFNASLAYEQPGAPDSANPNPLIFTTVKILYSKPLDHNHYRYGCEFAVPTDNLQALLAL